jgi:dihydrofolate reductase
MITLIAAVNHNNLLGKDNSMPWHVAEDLAHFKAKTLHKAVLMGRKTFDSLPKVLPDRTIYVLSSQASLDKMADNVILIHQIEPILAKYQHSSEELMVAGGASIYQQALPYCQKIILSLIDDYQHGDVYFPEFSKDEFKLEKTIYKDTFTIKEYKLIL